MTTEEKLDVIRKEFKKEIRKLERDTLDMEMPSPDDPDWMFYGINIENMRALESNLYWFYNQLIKAFGENILREGMYGVALCVKRLDAYDSCEEKYARLKAGDKKAAEILRHYKEAEQAIKEGKEH
jgi:hypothetical protein